MKKGLPLYLIVRIDGDLGYDEIHGQIVAAKSPTSARHSCAFADEGRDIWLDKRTAKCTRIALVSNIMESKVVLSDFRSA
tara:strand:+ start:15862 stop:16101 length:240 start_codon:yes stop_codon:yes gene_type:complete